MTHEFDDLDYETIQRCMMPETIRKIELEIDDLDYETIQRCIAKRQLYRVLPDGDGNMAGRVIAEICRGWEELLNSGYEFSDW